MKIFILQGKYFKGGENEYEKYMNITINNKTVWSLDDFVKYVEKDLPDDEYSLCYNSSPSNIITTTGPKIVFYSILVYILHSL